MDAVIASIGPAIFQRIAETAMNRHFPGSELRLPAEYSVLGVQNDVSVSLSFDGRNSQELTLTIAQVQQRDPAFGLDEVLEWSGAPEQTVRRFGLVQLSNELQLVQFSDAMLAQLAEWGDVLLVGDASQFAALRAWRRSRASDYTTTILEAQRRKEVDESWRAGDYVRVAELLQPIRARLGALEKRRLEYALRHLEGRSEPGERR